METRLPYMNYKGKYYKVTYTDVNSAILHNDEQITEIEAKEIRKNHIKQLKSELDKFLKEQNLIIRIVRKLNNYVEVVLINHVADKNKPL